MEKIMMQTICIAGLLSDTNLGDQAIADCAEHLIKIYKSDTTVITYLDIEKNNPYLNNQQGYIIRILRRLKRLFKMEDGMDKRINKLKAAYIQKITGSSLVFLVGGGLIKYKYQNLWLEVPALIEAAEALNIPVFINAAGVEGYDENDAKCQVLKKALNKKTVIGVTTRDDLETLKEMFLNQDKESKAKRVADSAVWAAEAYGVERNRDSDIVGVGLIRGKIFYDNGVNLSPDDLAQLYADLIVELDKKGQKYQLFTNGLGMDTELIDKIALLSGKELTKQDVLVPTTPKELMEILSGFKAVIAARLHANILSYALDIPSIGLVWNEKLQIFGKLIKHEDRFIVREDFNAQHILQKLDEAMVQGIDVEHKKQYVETTKESLKNLITTLNL